MPVDIVDLGVGRQRYAFFTNASGGLLDDLMVVRPDEAARSAFGDLFLVVNAGCKDADIQHLQTHIGHRCHRGAHARACAAGAAGPEGRGGAGAPEPGRGRRSSS